MEYFDNAQAYKEGWGLFCTDKGCEILKLDDPKSVDETYPENSPFPSDRDAFQFVVNKACEGSAYHRRALDFVPWAPDE
jgi:hypothetical protein